MSRVRDRTNIDIINRPPQGTVWTFHTLDLLSSPAWRARSEHCRRVLEFLEREHLQHGRCENGNLMATWSQLAADGIPRKYLAAAIWEAESLGLIQVTRGARKSVTESHVSRYGLTFFAMRRSQPDYQDGKPYYENPPNTWKQVTAERAAEIQAEGRRRRKLATDGRPQKSDTVDPNGNRFGTRTGTEVVPEREPAPAKPLKSCAPKKPGRYPNGNPSFYILGEGGDADAPSDDRRPTAAECSP